MSRVISIAILSLLLLTLLSACKPVDPDPRVEVNPANDGLFTLIEDDIDGVPIVVAGSKSYNLYVSFYRNLPNGDELVFLPSGQSLPVVMEDTEGNQWNAFGEAIAGPRIGQQLLPTHSMMAYWFAISAMYPGMDIYNGPSSNLMPLPLNDPDWTIPTDSLGSGSIWDGIQAIDNPDFLAYEARNFLQNPFYASERSLVMGVKNGDEIKAYPHLILNWHEVINDQIGGEDVTIGFCPLVGSGTIWSQGGGGGGFAVAGLLYNNNLTMFDRDTESIWSQVKGECVYGARRGEKVTPVQMIETTWNTWRQIVKEPISVMSENTGVNRDYTEDIFEYYRNTEPYIFYPRDVWDNRLSEKERIHVVIQGGTAKAYRLSSF